MYPKNIANPVVIDLKSWFRRPVTAVTLYCDEKDLKIISTGTSPITYPLPGALNCYSSSPTSDCFKASVDVKAVLDPTPFKFKIQSVVKYGFTKDSEEVKITVQDCPT